MSDAIEAFQFMKQRRKEQHSDRRDFAPEFLTENGIPFTTKNGGAHLIVEGKTCYIDFWPGTGRWIVRDGKTKGFGIRNLVDWIKS